MFTLPLISILAIATLNGASHASPVTAPRLERRDDAMDKYRNLMTQLYQHISAAITCYTDYVPKVQARSPPDATVLVSMDVCDKDYDKAAVSLRDAHRLARARNFPLDKLFSNKLPNVVDGRKSQHGPFTQDLQKKLGQAKETSEKAFKAYKSGQRAIDKVGAELKKKVGDRNIDVSKVQVKKETSSGGAVLMIVAGAFIASVPIVGVVTFEPFITSATALGASIEVADDAVASAVAYVNVAQSIQLNDLTIGRLSSIRQSLSDATDKMATAMNCLFDANEQLANIPVEQGAEANVIVQTHINQMAETNQQLLGAQANYATIRQNVLGLL